MIVRKAHDTAIGGENLPAGIAIPSVRSVSGWDLLAKKRFFCQALCNCWRNAEAEQKGQQGGIFFDRNRLRR